ncbi:hypothetical protein [Pseudomonas sp. NPDC089547]|uniref:hypothetical protein n=1 Tax=Pseudomonas sp. NPDC089547 TaxID=3390652 RepID=UPI003D07B092
MRIQNHKLAWRWIDPAYAVLPQKILAQMQAVLPDEARALHKRTLHFLDNHCLSTELRPEVFNAEQAGPERCSNWLKQLQPHLEQPVSLSWEAETALRTTWEVFISFWPEFCYPSSDDLVVFPESEEWVLLYNHDQNFQFGRRSTKA